ncbi:MAG: LLM class flavin-dependent oxidoreductase [Chloroflexi bacterium]|nr:MAG: LLM class flavin-dependent oxidoreductase [Chloroflexota bacterium]TME46723.1 MAG: LLM class flavin-dependent oxidoreductase [Chloroflexota bacterium]
MKIGIGLPTTLAGVSGELLTDWAKRAESGPFSSLGVLDRIAYENYEPFVALAAAAAVTRRIRLATMIVIAPLRNTALLAKQAASLDALSAGRLTLGLAVGARGEDYQVADVEPRGRGRRFAEQLEAIRDIWEAGRIGPKPAGSGPQLLVGGSSGEALARMARYGDGYMHGGGPPRAFAGAATRALAAWSDLGRPGRPVTWGMGYFALGDGPAEAAAQYLRHYYAFTGPFAEKIAAGNLTSPGAIVDFIRGYEDAGCDELILFPTIPSIDQVERLAGVIH